MACQVLVMDCGATNVRSIVVDDSGRLLAAASRTNTPVDQPGRPGMKIWDIDEIWAKLVQTAREVLSKVKAADVQAVTVTTFGADGAPVKKDGTLVYPVISWACSRTQELVTGITELMSAKDIFLKTGYQIISFNTLLRWLWLRRHEPGVLEKAHTFLMTPGLLSFRLTGEFSMDTSIASTTMGMDLARRAWSNEMLKLADLEPGFFPPLVEPGTVIGNVTAAAASETGLPKGIPVVAAGHDTQFAPIGSGVAPGEAVLSTGTWEIAMLRVGKFRPTNFGFEEGLIIETDALKGLWDPQMLMMGSGMLEWLSRHFYAALGDRADKYSVMISEASKIPLGSDGVTIVPSFMAGTGPAKKFGTLGTIAGLTLSTSPAHVYRAALEGLSYQLRDALRILSKANNFAPAGLRVVGGGSKNDLWNHIRAEVTGLPVTTVSHKEATVLGAAIIAFVGAGFFKSVQEAQSKISFGENVFEPSSDRARYGALFENYMSIPKALSGFYGGKA